MPRLRIQTHGLVPALVVTVLAVLLGYLTVTTGWAAWQSSRARAASGIGAMPQAVGNAPESVATTDHYGPAGPYSVVFAGTEVRDGLLSEVADPWIGISARSGNYRAISAPGLPPPAPHAVSLSASGDLLAWAAGSDVVLHDTVEGTSRTIEVPGVAAVGAFSPDESMLLVGTDSPAVLDLTSGEVVATLPGASDLLRRTAWRPDGSAVDLLSGRRLLTASVPGPGVSSQPTDIPARSALAWLPAGEQLVSLQPDQGARRLFVSTLGPDGELSPSRLLRTPHISLQRLLGASGPRSVAVVAYLLESGAVERVLDVRLDSGTVSDLTVLPSPGVNWTSSATMAVSTDALRAGSTDFDEPVWPWSHLARLVALLVVALFGLGLFVTRQPRT